MRRGLSGFLGVALAAAATLVAIGADVATAPPAAAAAPTPTPARTGVPANIYAVGDSITTATGTGQLGSEQKANSWVTGENPSSIPSPRSGSPQVLSMRHRLGIAQANAVNLASNGRRMQDFDDQANLLPASAQYVVVELGGNDLCRPSVAEMTSVADYRAHFRAGLQAVANRAPNALVFVASIPDIYNLWYLRGAPASVNPFVNDSPDQDDRAHIFWDNPTGFVIPCESLLDNPTSTSAADENRRQQVRARNIALNQVLAEECGTVLRCRFDQNGLFNRTSNRVSPPNGPLLPHAQWWFVNRDISFNQGSLNSICPVNFTYDGCGDHFHPSFWGQAKLAQSGHELSYQFLTDSTAPTVTTTAARPPDGNGVYARAVQVAIGGSDANGLRGQEVRIHQPDGSVGAWQPSIGPAPAVTISATGTSYIEARSLDNNGNLSASTIRAITIDPSQFGGVGGTVSGPSGPLSGIQVTLHASGAEGALRTTTTAADGTYAFTDILASGDVKVLADDLTGVHVDEWYDNAASHGGATAIDVPGNGASVTRNLALALTPGTVAGTVTGPSGGLSGIQVDLHATGSPGVVASTTTGAGGAYSLSVVPGAYKVQFGDPTGDHLTEWFDDQPGHGAAAVLNVNRNTTTTANALLTLTPGALGGTVSDSGGALTGITVDLHLAGASGVVATTTTNGAGQYSFPLVTPGDYKVRFTDATGVHLGEWHANAASHAAATSVTVVRNVTATVDAVLARTPGSLAGTVTGPSGGLAGVRVDLHATGSPGVLASTTTAAGGTYSFPTVIPGSYKVQFVDPTGDHLAEWFDNRSGHGLATVVNVTRNTTTTANAVLSLTPGALGGTVSDSGGALPGMTVDLHLAGTPGIVASTTTDGAGHYGFALVTPGAYKVHFTDATGAHLSEWHADAATHAAATSVTVVKNVTADVDAVLARTPGGLGGTVSGPSGGLSGIRVDLHASGTPGVLASTTTGASGGYSFPTVLPGSYKVQFVDPAGDHLTEWFDNRSSHGTATVVGVTPSTSTTANALLALTQGALGGTVSDTGGPLAGITVDLHAAGAPGVIATATTNGVGQYSFPTVTPGSYKVHFTDPSGVHVGEWHADATSHAAATSVAVVRNVTAAVNAVLARTPGTLAGTVTGPSGGLAGIRVDLHATGSPGVLASTTTGAGGTYSFPTVIPGSYKVQFTDPAGDHLTEWFDDRSGHSAATVVTVTPSTSTTVSAVLALVPGSIRGTVTGPDGPLEGIEVAVLPSGPSTTTDADGTYELSGLAPGPYTVASTGVPCAWLSDDASAVVPTGGGADEGVDLVVAEDEPGPHGLTGVPTWVEDAVRWLVDDCNEPPYMTGLPDGSFGATDDISRGQVLRAIWRIEGQPAEATPHGLDGVPLWIEPAVRWAVHHDYMTGFRDGTFRADAPINRAQIARLLYRLAGSPTPNDPHGLSDVPTWVEQAVRWMVAEGHASGVGGAFLPDRSTRRAEFASWAFRIYG